MLSLLPVFALTTHGLEAIAAREIGALPVVTIQQVGYRRIAAVCASSLASLLTVRTIDDVFLDLGAWPEIGRARTALVRLQGIGATLDLDAALVTCRQVRMLGSAPSFSVTASFVGRRNYSSEEIKMALATGITRQRRWPYRTDDATADLNIRLFIEQETAYAGMRLAARPLHERAYRRVHRRGALRSPVAAALVALAEVTPGMRVLDPCCGSGTIAIEAALRGACAVGGDIDPAAIAAARTNAAGEYIDVAFERMDARLLPLGDGTIDCVVSNPPWGRQVRIEDAPAAFYRQSLAEMVRVLRRGGRIVLLMDVPDLARPLGLRCVQRLEISLHGLRPAIVVYDAALDQGGAG